MRLFFSLGAILVALLAWSGPVASASVGSIDGTPLNVFPDAGGNLQARLDGSETGLFYPTYSDVGDAGFFVGVTGGPLAGEVFGPPIVGGSPSSGDWRPTSQSAATGAGTREDPFSQLTVYTAVDPSTSDELLRVTQTLHYVNGETRFRASYRVENVGEASVPFRASAAGDLYVEGSDEGYAVFEPGPPRFVGGRVAASDGAMGGLGELADSPWSRYQEATYSDVWEIIGSPLGAGFDDSIRDDRVDNGAGVQWDQHSTNALAPGASATYSVAWDARRGDGSAPDTTIRNGPEAVTRETGATFELASTEPGSTFECNLDGAGWSDCPSPHELGNLSQGPHRIEVRAKDLAGNLDPSPASWSWRIEDADTTKPAAAAPGQGLHLGSLFGTSATGPSVPTRVSWDEGTDDQTASPDLEYRLEERVDSGPWTAVTDLSRARAAIRNQVPGRRYAYRVIARDGAGNSSDPAEGSSALVESRQETSSRISFSAGWLTRTARRSAFGGGVLATTTEGAKARSTFQGRSVAAVMPRARNLGKAKVCVFRGRTTVACSTLNLSVVPSSGTGQRRAVFVHNGLDSAVQHRIEVTAVSGRVELDAIAILG